MRENQFGSGFSKEVEAILQIVHLGAQMGTIYIYPHEVRENLRMAGMKLDGNLESLTPFPTYQAPEFPEDYVPDFGEDDEEDPADADEALPALTEEEINVR